MLQANAISLHPQDHDRSRPSFQSLLKGSLARQSDSSGHKLSKPG